MTRVIRAKRTEENVYKGFSIPSTAKSFQDKKTRYVVCNSTSKRKFCFQRMAAVMLQ